MDERIRCSYCLQELNDMKDPRQLTCTHILCMSCIRSDCKQESAVKCPICSKVTDLVDLDSLDKPSGNRFSRKPEVQVTEHKCNRCEDNTAAFSYCLECADLICDKHLQMHQEYFKPSHTIIDIQVYARNAAVYTRTLCSEHKTSRISQACSRCYLMACPECNPPQNCSKNSAQGDHQFHTLSRIAEDFKKEFDELLKGCTDKVTEICMLEKETWLTLDSLIEKCQKMVADVQKRTEEQTAEIRKNSQQLIQQIHDYQVDRTNRVQVFVSDLLMKKEELEQLQNSARHLIQNCSVVEKIQQKEEKTSALKEGKEMEVKQCDWKEMVLLGVASQRNFKLCLTHVPSSLTHLRDKRPYQGRKCQSVCFTSHGQLLVACDNYLNQYCPGTLDITIESEMMYTITLSLATLDSGELLYLGCNCNIYSSREPYDTSTILFNVPQATRIATCRNDVFVLSKPDSVDKLTKYNLQSKVTKEYNFNSTEIVSICCHLDGDLLAVSKKSGVLYKYRVDEEKKVLEQIWSCIELPGAYAVCTDKCGWIYVAASGSRIYVVSEGKIHRCLERDELTDCENPKYGDIAVYDDTLVAIECGSDYFNIFSLKQE